jgi:hypothetical protein
MPTGRVPLTFVVRAIAAGDLHPPQTNVSVDGTATADNGNASFHKLSIAQKPSNPSVLDFVLKCKYVNESDVISDGSATKGEYAPSVDPQHSKYIQAFAVSLAGRDKDKYIVSYNAHMVEATADGNVFRDHDGDWKGRMGSWCGETNLVAGVRVWINSFSISLSPTIPRPTPKPKKQPTAKKSKKSRRR